MSARRRSVTRGRAVAGWVFALAAAAAVSASAQSQIGRASCRERVLMPV